MVLYYGLNAIYLYYQLTIKTKEMKKYTLTSTVRDSFGRFLTNDGNIQSDNTPLSEQMLFDSKEEALRYREDKGYFAMEVSEAITEEAND